MENHTAAPGLTPLINTPSMFFWHAIQQWRPPIKHIALPHHSSPPCGSTPKAATTTKHGVAAAPDKVRLHSTTPIITTSHCFYCFLSTSAIADQNFIGNHGKPCSLSWQLNPLHRWALTKMVDTGDTRFPGESVSKSPLIDFLILTSS